MEKTDAENPGSIPTAFPSIVVALERGQEGFLAALARVVVEGESDGPAAHRRHPPHFYRRGRLVNGDTNRRTCPLGASDASLDGRDPRPHLAAGSGRRGGTGGPERPGPTSPPTAGGHHRARMS